MNIRPKKFWFLRPFAIGFAVPFPVYFVSWLEARVNMGDSWGLALGCLYAWIIVGALVGFTAVLLQKVVKSLSWIADREPKSPSLVHPKNGNFGR